MLYESPGVRVEADEDGVATLRFAFPGDPVNALSPSRLGEIAAGVTAAVAASGVEILIVRSAVPAGFCGGFDTNASLLLNSPLDRAEFAEAGQRVMSRIAAAPFPTLAFVHGPCLGPGLELALACDVCLAVAGPDSAVGFPESARGTGPCWGGTARLLRRIGRRAATDLLQSGRILSAREAVRIGLFDDAFCERRARIELRTVLDSFQRHGRSPYRKRWLPRWPMAKTAEEANERQEFAAQAGNRTQWEWHPPERNELPVISDIGIDASWTMELAELAGRAILRGDSVRVPLRDKGLIAPLDDYLAGQIRRGFVTPLEAETARRRVTPVEDVAIAGIVLRSEGSQVSASVAGLPPYTLGIPLADRSSRVLEVGRPEDARDAATVRIVTFLSRWGYQPVVVDATAGGVTRTILYAVFDEAVRLVAEGVPIDRIDAVGSAVITEAGPLARMDRLGVTGLATAVKRLLPVAAAGWSFYRTDRRRRSLPNLETASLLWDSRFAAAVAETDCNILHPAGDLPSERWDREIADRLESRAINEAARCLHDDPFLTAGEVDFLAAEGAGVFSRLGGPLAIAEGRGLVACVQALSRLASRYGRRFTPCPGLVRRAVNGEPYFTHAKPRSTQTARLRVA